MNQTETIEVIKSLVKRFYVNGHHDSDRHKAEKEIKDYVKNHPEVGSKKVADDIWERCHYIMKHGLYEYTEAWDMIEKLLSDSAEGLFEQIKESVYRYNSSGIKDDLKEVIDRCHDYLKHTIEMDEKVGKKSIRHNIQNEIETILKNEKYNNANFEQMWSKVEDKIDWACSLTGDDIIDPKKMSSEEIKRTFVPNVYQKTIYLIDYSKLKDAGVKLITFDIDATLGLPGMWLPSQDAKNLFSDLREMGFMIALFSNADPVRVETVKNEIGAFAFLGFGGKPYTFGFDYFIDQYVSRNFGTELKYNQIAHVGNDITKDVQAGNKAGVITCLVRNFGGTFGCTRILYPDAHRVTRILEKKNIWYKHHIRIPNDQYYQFGDEQKKYS